MNPLASWIVTLGVLVVGICIGVVLTAFFIGDEVYDEAPPYDDELEE
jgi:hypothetical protein